jgi:agarase
MSASSLSVITPLLTFDSMTIPNQISALNQTLSMKRSGDEYALHFVSLSQQHFHTSLDLKPVGDERWDWSSYGDFCLALELSNTNARSTQVFINLFDRAGTMHSRSITVDGYSRKTYLVELKGEFLKGKTNYYSGLRSNPAPWSHNSEYATWMWGSMNVDLTDIVHIELSIHGSLIDHHLALHSVNLVNSPDTNPNFLEQIIDRYGQNATAQYQDKIESDEQLSALTKQELLELQKGALPQRSKYSGYTGGQQYQATGYFRTEKIDGKWSLIDPEGYPYFATGVDVIRLANAYTMTGIDYDHSLVPQRDPNDLTPEDSIEKLPISDQARASAVIASPLRKHCFQWLPNYDEPLAEHYGYMRELFEGALDAGETFSFYAANLERKYGKARYLEQWRNVTIDRMLNWGFTSLGNWAAPEFYNNDSIPYFANGWIIGDFKVVSSGDDFWSPLPDPFDPVFRERAEATVLQIKHEVKDSPWCVGIFIDNEKSWGRMGTIEGQHGIAIHTLGRDARECPTKSAFVDALKQKYTSIDALNHAWKTDIQDWPSLSSGVKDLAHNAAQLDDYAMLLEVFASQYFKVVNESLKAQLPNHLYLGARFADWGMTPDVVKAAAKHCDVISYNYYKEGLHPQQWSFLEEVDMPSIIGEFHFGSKETGFYHPGLVSATNQTERAQMYEDYMQTVIDNPYFVGAHWFQYLDSPITGRSYDGENYNVGFVSVADVPYKPMVEAAKRIHTRMYTQRHTAKDK